MTAALADRCDRYRARLDAHLAKLPDNAARRAFCDREIARWERLYGQFLRDDADFGPEVQAADFLITICDIATRQCRYEPVSA